MNRPNFIGGIRKIKCDPGAPAPPRSHLFFRMPPMKFGMFISAQQPRSEDPVIRFRQCVEQTIAARDAGFDAIAAGHHYLSPPYQSLQSLPLLTRLAADSGSMELCLSVILLPLLNPVQLAEEIASLDIMSEG